jgi:hypothetical protein
MEEPFFDWKKKSVLKGLQNYNDVSQKLSFLPYVGKRRVNFSLYVDGFLIFQNSKKNLSPLFIIRFYVDRFLIFEKSKKDLLPFFYISFYVDGFVILEKPLTFVSI